MTVSLWVMDHVFASELDIHLGVARPLLVTSEDTESSLSCTYFRPALHSFFFLESFFSPSDNHLGVAQALSVTNVAVCWCGIYGDGLCLCERARLYMNASWHTMNE